MSLRFSWEWQSAPDVKLPEEAATWSRLSIEVDEIITTLVEDRAASHGVRKSLDVPTYPLAEWFAINWWALNTSAHHPEHAGVRLTDAGSGFPWPDITLRSDHDFMWADVRQRNRAPESVRFLAQGRAVLEAEDSLIELSRFIDSTVRRLEEAGIAGTLLQLEWAAIQSADNEERDFCLVAAAWGFDPYDVPPQQAAELVDTDQALSDPALLADLAQASNFDSLSQAREWLTDAMARVKIGTLRLPSMDPYTLPPIRSFAPWREGYRRAQQFRTMLAINSTELPSIEDLVSISDTTSAPPANIDALVKLSDLSAGIVLGKGTIDSARRFAGARALARKTMNPRTGLSLLTRGSQYSDRVERAFAAEFLAPVTGIRESLDGDYSEESQRRVAREYRVSTAVIDHQIENQLTVA